MTTRKSNTTETEAERLGKIEKDLAVIKSDLTEIKAGMNGKSMYSKIKQYELKRYKGL
ncbi:hypothetical protein [Liquorilactobacillus satsumensis]|uniref:Uncharacterized protein n=1 Tax=Liquorilactobacillus satsumensis DSM 16230 = JCM 12392 TaxID=1423801 RepID=A0A0R1V239_9LACO|nr:hypothetical protein [Liquorilactobacillus satsumensis]KRL99757.1 hypothetical protein FD50_GL000077 [Liquorilactobacillus satsumensis DSM 16230 = JCM 12392]